MSDALAARVKAAEQTMRILWLALMSSPAIYGLVVYQLAQDADGGALGPNPLPPFVPPILAISIAATATVVFRAFSGEERVRELLKEPTPADPQLQNLSEAERRLSKVPGMFLTAYIVRWALFESIAIIGLVLGILTRDFEAFLPYGGAAIALIAMASPRIASHVTDAIPLLPPDVRGGY